MPDLKVSILCQAWWYTPMTPVLWRLNRGDPKFEASLSYIANTKANLLGRLGYFVWQCCLTFFLFKMART